MISTKKSSKMWPVVFAAAVIVVLAGSLGARLIARDSTAVVSSAPGATVPAPAALQVADLEVPCWGCLESINWPVDFQTDLDLLAPLGNGNANAAEWFALFTKEIGSRAADATAAMERRVEGPGWVGKALPPDDPLLLEAEPWCDQATMTFYPEIFDLDGYATRITNLLLPLNFARSWVARGLAAEDSENAMADFRRAMRLGRLLRQESVTVIADLVGLECVHLGIRGVYERALADNNLELALLASVVTGEVAPQRFATKQHLTSTDLMTSIRLDDRGEVEYRLQPGKLDTVIELAKSSPDRRFRCEAIVGLNIIRNLGTPEEGARVTEVLAELVDDADPKVAEGARWSRDTPTDVEQLKQWVVPPNTK
jgi:hypothetical protein